MKQLTSSLNKQTHDFNHAHSLTSMQYSAFSVANTHSESKPPSLPEKVTAVFSRSVHATRARIGPPNPNNLLQPSSHHVHVTLRVATPTTPCPTLSTDAEPACQRTETIFSVQCTVWCNQKCTISIHDHPFMWIPLCPISRLLPTFFEPGNNHYQHKNTF